MPNSEEWNAFLLKLGTSLGCLFLPSYNIMMKVLVYVMKQTNKKNQRHTDLKGF